MRTIDKVNLGYVWYVDNGTWMAGPYQKKPARYKGGTLKKFKLTEVTTEFDGYSVIDNKKIKTVDLVKKHKLIVAYPHYIPDGFYDATWSDAVIYVIIGNVGQEIITQDSVFTTDLKIAILEGKIYNMDDYGWKN
jgi:hypothetical protein